MKTKYVLLIIFGIILIDIIIMIINWNFKIKVPDFVGGIIIPALAACAVVLGSAKKKNC